MGRNLVQIRRAERTIGPRRPNIRTSLEHVLDRALHEGDAGRMRDLLHLTTRRAAEYHGHALQLGRERILRELLVALLYELLPAARKAMCKDLKCTADAEAINTREAGHGVDKWTYISVGSPRAAQALIDGFSSSEAGCPSKIEATLQRVAHSKRASSPGPGAGVEAHSSPTSFVGDGIRRLPLETNFPS